MDRFAAERISTGVVDACRQAAWRRGEIQNLFDPQAVAFQVEGNLDHVVQVTTGVTADEVRNDSLPQAELLTATAELFQKFRKQ